MFKKVFGPPGSSEPAKEAALEKAAGKFKQAQAEYLKAFVQGLSDPNVEERRATARLIVSEVIPAQELDENPRSRAVTVRALSLLVTELRPPESEHEMWGLNNAVFHFARRHILGS